MGMKRPAEEDYNSNVQAKRSRDDEQSLTLRFLLQSKVRFSMFLHRSSHCDVCTVICDVFSVCLCQVTCFMAYFMTYMKHVQAEESAS